MAFKKLDQYVADKNKDFFLLPNDKDYADVIFLYRSRQDVLEADTHYIKSPDYSGYVHCCGKGCPACAKGIRVQPKIFIPLYNYKTNKIEFWDRTTYFERQLEADVLSKFPNPSEWVFRITRNGEAGDQNTRYSIIAQGKNASYPYDKILADFNIKLEDGSGYESACRDCKPDEISNMLNTTNPTPTTEYGYVPTPRASSNDYQPASTSIPEPVSVEPPAFGNVPESPEFVPSAAEFSSADAEAYSPEEIADDLGDVNF